MQPLGNNTIRFGVSLLASSGNGLPKTMFINYVPCSLVRAQSCLPHTLCTTEDGALISCTCSCHMCAALCLQVTVSAIGSTANPAPNAPPSPPSPPPASPSPPPPPRCQSCAHSLLKHTGFSVLCVLSRVSLQLA